MPKQQVITKKPDLQRQRLSVLIDGAGGETSIIKLKPGAAAYWQEQDGGALGAHLGIFRMSPNRQKDGNAIMPRCGGVDEYDLLETLDGANCHQADVKISIDNEEILAFPLNTNPAHLDLSLFPTKDRGQPYAIAESHENVVQVYAGTIDGTFDVDQLMIIKKDLLGKSVVSAVAYGDQMLELDSDVRMMERHPTAHIVFD